MARLTDTQIRETLAQPIRLFSLDNATRRLSHSFRILNRYRTLRHYQIICAAILLLGIPIELTERDPLPFVFARLAIALSFLLGAFGLRRPRSVLVEGLTFGTPIVVFLLLAGAVPLIVAPNLFTQVFEAAYLAILVGISLLQIDILLVLSYSAVIAVIVVVCLTIAPISPRIRADLLLADLGTLAGVCNFRRIAMMYRCQNILLYFKSELQTRALTTLTGKLKISSQTDQLTGVGNRRYLEDASLALPIGTPVGILMIDIDRFKVLNDSLGHAEGDRCLRAVAEAIKSTLRTGDTLARYGGEEFIVMIETPIAGLSGKLAERIRAAVASTVRSDLGPVTVSIGIADGLSHRLETAVEAADRAMYRAKTAGRNRVAEDPNRAFFAATG